jgi:hypothetical protein
MCSPTRHRPQKATTSGLRNERSWPEGNPEATQKNTQGLHRPEPEIVLEDSAANPGPILVNSPGCPSPTSGRRIITARDAQLTIKAERSRNTESIGRSEFCYGSFVR